MFGKISLALFAGLVLAVPSGVGTSTASGAQWYPFYGYRRPSYLGQPCVVYAQPAAPVAVQPVTPAGRPATVQAANETYLPAGETVPAAESAAPAEVIAPQPYQYQYGNGGGWYPFYGYRRPAYLDQ
jgi:hypothetical protein